jgi:fermentation-respiration switch protein FrsA (DUF1100 family)
MRRNLSLIVVTAILAFPFLLYACVMGIAAWNQDRIIYPGAGRGAASMQAGWTASTQTTRAHGRLPIYVHAGRPGRPTVIFLHGNFGSYDSGVSATVAFVEAGMTVVLPEYPGFGGELSMPSQAGLSDAAITAYDGLVAAGTPSSSIHVVGNSLGSTPAIAVATQRRPASLTLVSAYTDMAAMARRRIPLAPGFLLKDAFDNADGIEAVHVPVLVVHGLKDDFVPTWMGRELARRAKAGFVGVDAGHEAAYGRAAQDATLKWMEEGR